MSTPTDGNRDLLTVVASMRAADGKTEELRAALEALIEPTRNEEGYVTGRVEPHRPERPDRNRVRRIA